MKKYIFSKYKINQRKKLTDIGMEELRLLLRSNRSGKICEELRKFPKCHAKNRALKKQLPLVTISAVFEHQRKAAEIVSISERICMDIDDIKDWEIDDLKKAAMEIYCSLLCLMSPNGGLRIICRIRYTSNDFVEEHKTIYEHLSKLIEQELGLKADPQCKDITRGTFVPEDPYFLENENASAFSIYDLVFIDLLNELEVPERPSKTELTNLMQQMIASNIPYQTVSDLCVEQYPGEESIILQFIRNRQHESPTSDLLRDPRAFRGRINQELDSIGSDENTNIGLLEIKSVNEWLEIARREPAPMKLFDELWLEGQLCILFSDTNQGKSILAVQIGASISSGTPIPGFEMTAEKQPVLYFDFELSKKQFELRYCEINVWGETHNHYQFEDDFDRIELNPLAELPKGQTFEEQLKLSIERVIQIKGTKVLIIDNITYLNQNTEKGSEALYLMQYLKELKARHGLSILVIAHTPKRNPSKPIHLNHLGGSKMIANLADSIFAIAESKIGKEVKYLKQIKARQTVYKYASNNVIEVRIRKKENFLGFEYIGTGPESHHLKASPSETERLAIIEEMKKEGKTNKAIGEYFGVTEGAVRKWLIGADEEE